MDKELLYNGSKIKDITAYEAITNIERGGRYMNSYDIKKGDIWEVEYNDSTKTVVVLACFDRYAATVTLQEQPGSAAIMIRARNIMYADTARLGWVYYEKMENFVRELSAEEDQELRKAIADALELQYENQEASDELEEARREVAELRKRLKEKAGELEEAYIHMEANAARVDELEEKAGILSKQLKGAKENQQPAQGCGHVEAVTLLEERTLREDLAAAQREAEVYKGLYENMLARALG